MVMSPLDLRNQEFHKAFRGYDEDEVDSFLEVVNEDYETLYRENLSLKEQLSQKEESIWKYRDLEETLKSTLVLAQKTAEDVRVSAEKESQSSLANAKREAELLIKEATVKAEAIVREAREKGQRLLQEYSEVQKQTQMFKVNMRTMLQAQIELLNEHFAIMEAPSLQGSALEQWVAENGSDMGTSQFQQVAAGSTEYKAPAAKAKVSQAEGYENNNPMTEDTIAFEAVPIKKGPILKEPRYQGFQGD